MEIIDIPNTFIQTRIEYKDKKVILNMKGKLSSIMMNKSQYIYWKYVTVKHKVNTMIYVKAINFIYVITRTSIFE